MKLEQETSPANLVRPTSPGSLLSPPFHYFQVKNFKKARPCGVCKFPVEDEGCSCRACKYTCHKECEVKVVTVCDPSSSYELKSPSLVKSPDKLHRSRSLDREESFAMDITYVTERIIVVIFPKSEPESLYRRNLRDVTRMLRTKHGTNYTIFNLSEKRNDLAKLNSQVLEFGWPQNLAPPLERLCSICKSIDSFINSNPQNIAVLHSKADRGRAGIIIAAYTHYSNICASADQALDRFAMKQFYDDKLSAYMHPSQKRYVHYFSGLLSGEIRMNNNPLYLQRIIICGVPNFDAKGGCRPFIKIYQGMQHIYSTGIYSATEKSRKIIMSLDSGLQIRGDIFIKCYHKSNRPLGRYPVFRLQFHTCTIDTDHLTFEKSDLDDAIVDSRFPESGRVEFWFSYNKEEYRGNGSVQDSMMAVESSNDPLVKWDSYENFDSAPNDNISDLELLDSELGNEGPVDGSLYATVRKEKKYTEVMIQPPSQHEHFGDIDGPHSIDSGISSNSGVRNAETERRSSPYSPNLKDEQTELDQLVHGMLQEIQSIPDAPNYTTVRPYSSSLKSVHSPSMHSPNTRTFSSIRTTVNNQDNDYAMPKSRSRPTGIISVNGNRQVLTPEPNKTHSNVTFSKLDDLWEESDSPFHIQKTTTTYSYNSPVPERRRVYSDGQYPVENLYKRHVSYDDSVRFHNDGAQSWLQRQQEKLKARREGRGWEDRHVKEQQLLAELRTAQHRKPMPNGESTDDVSLGFDFSSSSRETSPTKCSSYTLPLHVNTYNGHASAPPTGTLKPPIYRNTSAPSSPLLPHRTSSKDITRNRYPLFQTQSKTLVRQKSDTSYDRERPFMTTKRAHQLAKEQIANNQTSPHHVIAYSSAYNQTAAPDRKDHSGLLGLLGTPSKQDEPAHEKLDKLEQSLQALSSSPTHSPQHSPFSFSQSTPKKANHLNDGPSWSPSVISSSPPSSPSRSDRPVTPAFPVPPGTPYQNQESSSSTLPPKSPNLSRKDRSPSPATLQKLQQDLPGTSRAFSSNGQSSPTIYYGQSRPSSMVSLNEPSEVIHHHPMFVKDTSKYWYKPNISREEAITILRDKPPGTFVVRDSNSFPGAYGLALKVATPPPNVQNKTGDPASELVRHFLIEPTAKGVRLKGCPNEPIFGSLSALVYQHSITPLALPGKLLLPEHDPAGDITDCPVSQNDALLEQGAACSVLYLRSIDMESLTGPQAIKKALSETLAMKPPPTGTPVHFKVSNQGITLTDNTRKLFFRRHYPVKGISHCGLDADDRQWTQVTDDGVPINTSRCFGFISRKPASQTDNQCHLFAELDPDQPAAAIVNFVTKVMMAESQPNQSNMV